MAIVLFDDLVLHGKVVVGIHRPFLGHQVPHMAVGGEDLKVLAKIFFYGFRLCWRFNNNQIFTHGLLSLKSRTIVRPVSKFE